MSKLSEQVAAIEKERDDLSKLYGELRVVIRANLLRGTLRVEPEQQENFAQILAGFDWRRMAIATKESK